MDVAVVLHASAALLLLVAGMAKVVRPAPTGDLLATLGLPASAPVVVGLGVMETAVGVSALMVGGAPTAAAVGVLYVAFAIAVVRAMRVGAASCGCFGRVEAPPSWIHVVGNAAFAVASFASVAGDTPLEVMDRQAAGGIGFVLIAGAVAGVALVAFTAVRGARRDGAARAELSVEGDPS